MKKIMHALIISCLDAPSASAQLKAANAEPIELVARSLQSLKNALTKPLVDALTYELSFLEGTLTRWKADDTVIVPLLKDVPPATEIPADPPYTFNRFTKETAQKIEYFTRLFDAGFRAVAGEEEALKEFINRLRLELENYLTDAIGLKSRKHVAAEQERAQKYAQNRHYAEQIDAFARRMREWLTSI